MILFHLFTIFARRTQNAPAVAIQERDASLQAPVKAQPDALGRHIWPRALPLVLEVASARQNSAAEQCVRRKLYLQVTIYIIPKVLTSLCTEEFCHNFGVRLKCEQKPDAQALRRNVSYFVFCKCITYD